jgi:uncharacterized protein (DUF2141 family)
MKHILILISIFFSLVTYSQTNTLTVTVTNFKNNQGKVMVGIFNGPDNFTKKPIFGKSSKINAKTAKVVFDNIPDGEYAVSVYHDENGNNELDTGMFGIPKERYGFSNDAKGIMGPPKYEDAKFQVTQDQSISVKIN